MTKDAANETRKDLNIQLQAIAKEHGCTAKEAICILDGIIKASLELARAYKEEVQSSKVAAQN